MMLLTFEIFGRTRNDGKKVPKIKSDLQLVLELSRKILRGSKCSPSSPLTLFDMGGHDGPKDVLDHCA